MTKERRYKEIGAKIYEVILHIFAIGGLFMTLDASNMLNGIGISISGPQEIWWGWLIVVGVAVLRLFILKKLKEGAQDSGMLLTEFQEEIKKRNNS
jgi:hypothetical protein